MGGTGFEPLPPAFFAGKLQARTLRSLASNRIDTAIAAIELRRSAREVEGQGNIKTSKTGLILSGQKRPATPKARHNCKTRHNPKISITMIPKAPLRPSIETCCKFLGEITKVPRSSGYKQEVIKRD